jgi:phosphoribosyl 1,2-cyclic phosphodiesterase
MSLELCVLASGSSGNCSVVRSATGVFLIDCGIGPRVAAARLAGTGVSIDQITAVCLTHLDRDHFNSLWTSTLANRRIRIFCPADRVLQLLSFNGTARLESLVMPFDHEAFEPVPGVIARTLRLAHDDTGSHAFHFSTDRSSIGYATDLGSVPAALIEHFDGVDLLAIESNYDPEMQRGSGRPVFLQRRIMGGHGHLSNQQAMAAVKAVFDRCQRHRRSLPRHVVLLHRSQQCNCPDRIRDLFHADPRLVGRLVLSEQHSRTEWMKGSDASRSRLGEQLSLFPAPPAKQPLGVDRRQLIQFRDR